MGNHRVFASGLVPLLALTPAATTTADTTGFALLKRYLDGREPALRKGCVLDVELTAARDTNHAPVYDLAAAAGFWGPESVPEDVGWTELPGVSLKPRLFMAWLTGPPMEPLSPKSS